MAISHYGNLKLGPDDSEPDYPYLTWMAMLFAAGTGIGLMFFAVAEPMQHFSVPTNAEPYSLAAVRESQLITFFHCSLSSWSPCSW